MAKLKNPAISVIMSVKNGQKFLNESVNSILSQTYKDFEFIIIDDGSNDQTWEILKSYKDNRIVLFKNNISIGLTKSLNMALKISRGELIARMDADDISKPTRFEEELRFLRQHLDIAEVGSWVEFIDDKGKKIKVKKLPTSSEEIKKNLIKANQLFHPTIMIRKKVLTAMGGYYNDYEYSQDFEMNLRIASQHKLANIPKVLLLYRIQNKEAISYKNLKKQAKFALKARLEALDKLNYPKWQYIYLIKPLISYIIPYYLLIVIYKLFFWKK